MHTTAPTHQPNWHLSTKQRRGRVREKERVFMDLVTGAMGSLLPKLGKLLNEYKLQKGVKEDIKSLEKEMKIMRAALHKVAEVPRDQLEEGIKIWAGELRELSYNMEDVVDKFLVHVNGESSDPNSNKIKQLGDNIIGLFTNWKSCHQIANEIKDIKNQVNYVAKQHKRYRVSGIVAANVAATTTTFDPRLPALYNNVSDLVGINEPRDELIKRLTNKNDQIEIVSIVGFGGLGKTTLAKAVYDSLKPQFDCTAFVSVSQTPDMVGIFRKMLHQLDKKNYAHINEASRDATELIDELRMFLRNKRYLIVIDDIWNLQSWIEIKHALNENSCASRIITTTRDLDIATNVGGSFKINPLNLKSSKTLFCGRIFGSEDKLPRHLGEASTKILDKCGGVPLAIITIASVLNVPSKIQNQAVWDKVCAYIGSGLEHSPHVKTMRIILSLSYYHLPYHLRTCLLYLSIYPEDHEIHRDDLIWKWIAEGFIQHKNSDDSLFEVGRSYFTELINSGMILPCIDFKGDVTHCRLHDMVLGLICSLSSEENFVTILNHSGGCGISSPVNVRRLSIQNRNEDDQRKPLAFMSKSQVRSVTTFPPAINQMMSLSRFDVLRVLDLNGCHLGKSKNLNLEDVVNLFHLRYLGLAGTNICQLPAGIGNLLFLQVLDVRYNSNLKELPSSICKLRRLMCLLVNGYRTSLPDGLGNLTSMEVLKKICATLNIVKELRKLSMLRELKVKFERNASLEYGEAFLESLRHLKNIQSVIIRGYFPSMDLLEKSWLPPQQLRAFESVRCGAFSGVPEWIKRDPLCLSDLAELVIGFVELREEDLLILGRLPVLRRLWLWSAKQTPKVLSIGADGFHYLTSFTLYCESPRQIVFQRGAFPKVTVGIDRHGVTLADVKDAVVALRQTVNVHPLHPVITFDIRPLIQQEEAQRASEMNPEFFFDEELIREQRKLPGKFRKFRAETT
ncbi:disease resistance protein RGA5-like isoform X2 [Lolium perenne]|uniref:disease resistance protein RGA5-like isoform X2 n=1 Tax=Lolium perenne TaxID=4522 RepID=UPI003A98D0C6